MKAAAKLTTYSLVEVHSSKADLCGGLITGRHVPTLNAAPESLGLFKRKLPFGRCLLNFIHY